VVRTDRRDELRELLQADGVSTAIHYPTPIHLTAAYADVGLGLGALPVAEALAGSILSLPLWPGMSDATLEQLAESVGRAVPA
jgi:dTDP-4-amino-4,6-dideoxygalactose transaminase